MKRNTSGIDRQLHILIGAMLVNFALFTPLNTGWRVALLALAIIVCVSAVPEWSILWKVLGISTAGARRSISNAAARKNAAAAFADRQSETQPPYV